MLQFNFLPILSLSSTEVSISSSSNLEELPSLTGIKLLETTSSEGSSSVTFEDVSIADVKKEWRGLNHYLEQSIVPKPLNNNIVPFFEWSHPPGFLSHIPPKYRLIPEEELIQIRQENVMEALNTINMKELKLSTSIGGKKGIQLPDLKDKAKQFNIPITNQKKIVIAKRIYDAVKDIK